MSLTHIPGALMSDGWDTPLAEIQAQTRAWLMDRLTGGLLSVDVTEWDIDQRVPQLRYDQAHWSDSYNGIVHNCAWHLPEEADPTVCFPDSRPVVLVCDIPTPWLGEE